MRTFSNFVKWFLYITTGIMVVCGINYTLAGVETVTVDIFWKILFCGFVTTFVTVLMCPKDEDGKAKAYVKCVLHYIMLCVIMIPLGVWFGWIGFDWTGVVTMMVDVGGVYLAAFLAYYIIDCRQADEINKVLREKYGDE